MDAFAEYTFDHDATDCRGHLGALTLQGGWRWTASPFAATP